MKASNQTTRQLRPPALILVGPTAIGKTALSLAIAEHFSCEVISLDSMQVYRYMDIGTAKATPGERQRVLHHLIDIVDPDEEYNVARYVDDAAAVLKQVRERGSIPLFVGGTGLYLKGLLEGLFEEVEADPRVRERLRDRLEREGRQALYQELCVCDPGSAARIHPNDTQRLLRALEIFVSTGKSWSAWLAGQNQPPLLANALKIGLSCDRETLYERINRRVGRMLEQGLLDEVKKLLAMGYDGSLKPMQAIGYRHMVKYLAGEWSWDQSISLLARDTRRYAKRQFTWFNRDREIAWFQPDREEEVLALINGYLAGNPD